MGIFKDNGINNSVEYNMVKNHNNITGRRWTNNWLFTSLAEDLKEQSRYM